MATLTSRLQKGRGFGPRKVHASGLSITGTGKAPGLDWYNVGFSADDNGKNRKFTLGMSRVEMEFLKAQIDYILEKSR